MIFKKFFLFLACFTLLFYCVGCANVHHNDTFSIYWLGSSVTYGYATNGYSMADVIAEHTDTDFYKNAVSGTTLQVSGLNEGRSYVERFESSDMQRMEAPDIFIIQLSTNDAIPKYFENLGAPTPYDIRSPSLFERTTTCGALEYIISSAINKWDCEIAIYTNPYYDSANYSMLVECAKTIALKWDVIFVDMYNDVDFNILRKDAYMFDNIHPTIEGYSEWIAPYMEEKLGMSDMATNKQ